MRISSKMKVINRSIYKGIAILLVLSLPKVHEAKAQQQDGFRPGEFWTDTNGNPINAHGGSVTKVGDTYYWYGEEKIPGKSEYEFCDAGVSCYRSTDLYNWEPCLRALALETDPASHIYDGTRVERPKVIYNEKLKQYVMYFKLYPHDKKPYSVCYMGIALSKTPEGPYKYSHRFLPATSDGAGDFSIVRKDDGSIFHFAVRKPDKAFVVAQLTDDGMYPAGPYKVLGTVENETEAPAIVPMGKDWYMVASGSSGWAPNKGRSYRAKNLVGPYVNLGNPYTGEEKHKGIGSDKSFGGQITYIIPVKGKKNKFIAMLDLWKPKSAYEGRYAWLPMTIKNKKINIEWKSYWKY